MQGLFRQDRGAGQLHMTVRATADEAKICLPVTSLNPPRRYLVTTGLGDKM